MRYIVLSISMVAALAAHSIHGMGTFNFYDAAAKLFNIKPTKRDFCALIEAGNVDALKKKCDAVIQDFPSHKAQLKKEWLKDFVQIAQASKSKWQVLSDGAPLSDPKESVRGFFNAFSGCSILVAGMGITAVAIVNSANSATNLNLNTVDRFFWSGIGIMMGCQGLKALCDGVGQFDDGREYSYYVVDRLQAAQNMCEYLQALEKNNK